jgi:hypothetical protein
MAVMGMCAVVWHNLPAGSDVYAPFPVSGVVGEPARGRGIVATVTGIQIAPQLVIESAGGGERFSAVGQWVVVQTSLQSGDRPEVAHADLTVGSRVYLPTGRLPSGSTLGGDIEPGFVSNGAWIFDVAPEPLGTEPSARERGTMIHGVFEKAVAEHLDLESGEALREMMGMGKEAAKPMMPMKGKKTAGKKMPMGMKRGKSC